MPNTTTLRTVKNLRPRSRTGVAIAAGLCASVAVTGASVAAGDGGGEPTQVFAPATATQLADATGAQADTQQAAAEKAEELEKTWTSPIEGDYTLSATYGNSGDRWASGHSGQDFAVDTGTPVHAAHSGTVVKAGGNGAGDGPAYGNAVVIKHDDDTFTQYAHLSEVDVKAGQKVSTNDEIGLSGNTGNSSGPHLHFEIRTTADYGSAVDPVAFLAKQDLKL
ncbi:M23 family metallopeptidase [Streptomyces johnsoniae]|uniref:M23 family metallopeptidase n=1 Tax=Streptomyces johnsoniae TaxID=3075532 RepID=A0ABU2SCU3_9ACTN|nr:M23 family metallopeptidase [Streptomyces sp. DSM 41886]MDT0446628.1 M23 family metallopeptidase [Streptomyces sp. DSM 41886]